MRTERIHMVRKSLLPKTPQSVIYWMRCEHRVQDNWALLYALQQANDQNLPLLVLFCLSGSTPQGSYRQKKFLFDSLTELQSSLEKVGIQFLNCNAHKPKELAELITIFTPSLLVTDHSALKPQRLWLHAIKEHTECAIAEVDGRNIVPVRYASNKQEYAARTIRPKIHRLLEQFLTPFPKLTAPQQVWKGSLRSEPLTTPQTEQNSPSVLTNFKSGEKAAQDVLNHFVNKKIYQYLHRNDPTKNALSNLSPYLHFGMVSAQRAVLTTLDHPQVPAEAKEVFLEELVVRRELADNFCFYNPQYDSTDCFPKWAQETLTKHRSDPRDYLYSLKELEQGRTHDPLWNAAQQELLYLGKMHGYMRMYWAKKILEWTASPEEAMHHAIYLNDTYSLDGVDSNGYTGIAWSIGGIHDRPWRERAIFGTIRYMNYNGAKRKFNVEEYIQQVTDAVKKLPT
ncbi:deoxyribodipyrimidine photo-lyase [Halodesulfovibrio marinisediminis]|uniref:Deoxyribodipyrimidine photo-lyase n=1 Tax=Halodesulfovibrio marinisediminis DSM 17456 TaxID=1121457 RepID=A0A1N6F7Q1_9BACT|nr:deoxyribodipyrimidine photo-lyase [Halodesulfovibrio marinisediminis]SIN91301.1 Deoxyribodipyrimidine photo-lyase type II [Halodesulfovibrio marinisediminis DSM 17456]